MKWRRQREIAAAAVKKDEAKKVKTKAGNASGGSSGGSPGGSSGGSGSGSGSGSGGSGSVVIEDDSPPIKGGSDAQTTTPDSGDMPPVVSGGGGSGGVSVAGGGESVGGAQTGAGGVTSPESVTATGSVTPETAGDPPPGDKGQKPPVDEPPASASEPQVTTPPQQQQGGPQATTTPQATPTPPTMPQIVKSGLGEDARASNAINDKPQDDIDKDTLGFRDYVLALRAFIISQDTTTPLTISVNGAWGSGKSSLMSMLRRQLEPEPPADLWRVKLRWLGRWARGTAVALPGRLLVWSGHWDSEFIELGLAFTADEDAADEDFDELFDEYVASAVAAQIPPAQLDALSEEGRAAYRERIADKARPWARAAMRRRKMKPPSHPTVWFNAWKFTQQEQVWSALALAVLDQLKGKYGFLMRLAFLAQLTWKRTDKSRAVARLARKFLFPAALAVAAFLYNHFKGWLPQPLILRGEWAWLAPVLAAVWQAWKEVENPFHLPVRELVNAPAYEEKVGFIGTFEEDFSRIVEVAIRRSFFWRPRKLVVFIDDLDRCGPLQAASIIEAINLFLDSVGCVFVLGMDVAAVATSIEVKYKELTERMRRDSPDVLSPGSLFLDKIVQIPFNVPRPNETYIDGLVTSITYQRAQPSLPALRPPAPPPAPPTDETERGPLPPPDDPGDFVETPTIFQPVAPEPPKADRGSFAREDIKGAVVFASRLLKENPRQVKRFVNLFRLQVYIADERGLLSEEGEYGLTPRRLAVWVAWYMQWPEILKQLSGATYSREMRLNLRSISRRLVARDGDGVDWSATGRSEYLQELANVRLLSEDSPSHWSKLPWTVWVRDADFLSCLKHLEPYWEDQRLLDSVADMTQCAVEAARPPGAASSSSHAPAPPAPPAAGRLEQAAGGSLYAVAPVGFVDE